MGAVPKRKISKGRKNRRRAQDFLKPPALSICPKCKQAKRPHFKCPNCGHYGKLEEKGRKSTTSKTTSPKNSTKTNKKTKSTSSKTKKTTKKE